MKSQSPHPSWSVQVAEKLHPSSRWTLNRTSVQVATPRLTLVSRLKLVLRPKQSASDTSYYRLGTLPERSLFSMATRYGYD